MILVLSVIGHDPAAGEYSLADTVARSCAEHFTVTTTATQADLIWICYDTPIGPAGEPQVEWVLSRIRQIITQIRPTVPVLISSQLPVGTTARLEAEFPDRFFAHSPENIRVASAMADFAAQARVVVGRRSPKHDEIFRELFAPFTGKLILTDPETAECCKHFLNTFLALQIVFANEMAKVCSAVGADPLMVAQALKAERRVSPAAPLRPGGPYGGGHLGRDVFVVNQIAREHGLTVPVLSKITESNEAAV